MYSLLVRLLQRLRLDDRLMIGAGQRKMHEMKL
jgi:hypothetical protein